MLSFKVRDTTPTSIGKGCGIETPTSLFRNPNLGTLEGLIRTWHVEWMTQFLDQIWNFLDGA